MVDFVGADFFEFVGGAEAPANAVRVDACRAAHGNVVDGIADHEAFMWRAAQRAHSLFHHVRKLEQRFDVQLKGRRAVGRRGCCGESGLSGRYFEGVLFMNRENG